MQHKQSTIAIHTASKMYSNASEFLSNFHHWFAQLIYKKCQDNNTFSSSNLWSSLYSSKGNWDDHKVQKLKKNVFLKRESIDNWEEHSTDHFIKRWQWRIWKRTYKENLCEWRQSVTATLWLMWQNRPQFLHVLKESLESYKLKIAIFKIVNSQCVEKLTSKTWSREWLSCLYVWVTYELHLWGSIPICHR